MLVGEVAFGLVVERLVLRFGKICLLYILAGFYRRVGRYHFEFRKRSASQRSCKQEKRQTSSF